ncbi:MAG: hypothetical protein ACAH59_09335 [Pseudobdellovibrionaceae bacterium]
MSLHYSLFFLAFFLFSCQTTPKNQFTESRQPALTSADWPEGPIDDCIQSELIFGFSKPVSSECTFNYVHIYPSDMGNTPILNHGQAKIGSFNVFHMGDKQAPLKDFRRIAKIMNQWDLVGTQEFMPLSTESALDNRLLFQALKGKDKEAVHSLFKNQPALAPGHIRMLIELQKLDSSWALIMQPVPEGEGSSGEMAGFFYRSSVTRLKEWDYCPKSGLADVRGHFTAKNWACLVQVPEAQRKLMSRSAFAAFFQIGNFDFIALTSHIRFRPATLAKDRALQSQELCEVQSEAANCRISQENVGRFYEVKAVLDQIDELKKASRDQDVIYMGDFNLELINSTRPHWKMALASAEGFDVFQTAPTTLGVKKTRLVSNYDHFILHSQLSKECLTASMKPFDFTQGEAGSKDPLMKDIGQLLTEQGQAEVIDYKSAELSQMVKFQNSKGQVPFRKLSPTEIQNAQESLKNALVRARKNSIAAYLEFLSDHLPIEMVCQTSRPDDD